jgi:outer membrane protein assembly factor BamA
MVTGSMILGVSASADARPAQETASEEVVETRSQQIESARANKEVDLKPEGEPRLQHDIKRAQNSFPYKLMTSDYNGFSFEVGNLGPSAGLAAGPQYTRNDLLGGKLALKLRARVGTSRSYLGRVDVSVRNLFGSRAFLDISADDRSLSEMPYYGSGPDSEERRTNYRLEDTTVDVRPGLTLIPHLRVGAIGSYMKVDVGPGHSRRYISADREFTPLTAPGIDQQTSYWRGGGFLQLDWSDRNWAPTSGGKYSAQYLRYLDRELDRFSFLRLDFDAAHYIPLFNHTRVIALHGATSLTKTNGTQRVPFYMQPTLGGADSLRGYASYRFYGNNSVLANVEYRWEVSPTLSMAAFADGGKVFDRWGQWNLHQAESDVGFAVAFRMESKVAFRVDTGFSHEGVQIWFHAKNVF